VRHYNIGRYTGLQSNVGMYVGRYTGLSGMRLRPAGFQTCKVQMVNQRLYLLSLLQSSGLQRSSLHLLFNALVINKLSYALPAYAGQPTADDKNRINTISTKAMRRGLTLTAFDIDTHCTLKNAVNKVRRSVLLTFRTVAFG